MIDFFFHCFKNQFLVEMNHYILKNIKYIVCNKFNFFNSSCKFTSFNNKFKIFLVLDQSNKINILIIFVFKFLVS